MRVLLITGRLAAEDVRRAVHEAGAGCEVEMDVLPLDIAALVSPKMLLRWLRSRPHTDFDLILVSGLIRSDFSDVERAIGVPIRLGPKHAYDLRGVLPLLGETELSPTVPACVLLAAHLRERAEEEAERLEMEAGCAFELEGVKIGGSSRMKVLAEVVDADRLSERELEQRIAYFLEQGADMIDLGISLDASSSRVRRAVEVALTFGVPVSVDTLEPNLIRAGIDAGCHMVLSLRQETLERLGGLEEDVAYVVLPEPEGGVESLVHNMELARRAGAHMLVADPVLEPVGRGCSASICACIRLRALAPDVPLFFGVGNVSELLDADSVGVNALLAALGSEVGASVLFTPEHSDKCRGSVRELSRAARMMALARHRNTPPKDLGLDLLVLKEKRRRPSVPVPEGCVEGEENEEWQLDPEGAYTISLTQDGRILARHRDFCVLGSTAREVCDAILKSGRISSLSHAMYLGRELARAELALRLGRSYAQDDEW
ncbi:dihydropteroate synthase-like protein [Methermicoccus shengliensis]|uniref:Dihydropteroate synthase-like protein n=1 Tax=Methermicoccus shengliensis TaxID=660064 RepID=A0A832RVB6_9EURY|nr:dihydropteroate synthase-like protein [Methermicoccus shengliensis]KUK04459.1 MAG: Dihydropteroate synthase-related protein [Euryarchaeota archaeon 55_53]KUK30086.1 MAG: Dihydropteroate synthase-related protein [Methanosarcinales archeaon 56_1174]MDI3487498.1 hypothetical protein [Methanosarcinales archaeon]MDN5295175.1 hypothetical protein [Methanosarcinales archaeon]HIH69159.1 dihydropteroate synthase-like protein [Methermicoccus shengliensis]